MDKRSALTALAAAALAVAVPGPAHAAEEPAADVVKRVTKVKVDPRDPSTATVRAQYRCSGGDGVMWASVKQSRTGVDLTGEGSSLLADSWYDVHAPVVCDGRLRTQTFVLTGYEQFPFPLPPGVPSPSYVPLVDGEGWVQLCLTVGDAEDQGAPTGFDSVMEHAPVHVS